MEPGSCEARDVPPTRPGGRDRRTSRRTPLLAGVAAIVVSLGLLVAFVAVRGREGMGTEDLTTDTTAGRPAPAVLLAAAPAASRAAGTARVRASQRGIEAGEPIDERVEGVLSFDDGAFDLTFAIEGADEWEVVDLDDRAFSDGTTVWSPLPDDPEFVRASPVQVKNVLRNKKYLSFELETKGEPFVDTALAAQHGLGFSIGSKPGDVLSYLSSVGTATPEGSEQLGGEDVDRYGVELDLDSLQRALPSDERSFDAYDFRPDVPHTFPGKVWLDRQGRLRKLTYRLDLAGLLTDLALREDYVIDECPEPSPALAGRLRSGDRRALAEMDALDEQCTQRPARPEELVIEGSVELSDYGVPLVVTPPPPAQVLDSETFFEALLGSADDLFAAPTTSVRSRAGGSTSSTKARSTSTSRPRTTTTRRS